MKILRQRAVPAAFPEALPDSLHPVLKRVYAARCANGTDTLNTALAKLHPPELLLGMAQAVQLLEHALSEQQAILIVGDFDADGATSSALMVSALRSMGAAHVDYLVPNRFEFGYGLTPEIVAVAAARRPQAQLIVTVDNGISSVEGVAAAHALGMRVLVTDHHLPGPVLPHADAIVNPNQQDDSFPSKCLAGVGVAFYLLMALRSSLRDKGWFNTRGVEPNLADYLDLVALGTVADLVPLDTNNRVLVQQGLQRIRAGRCRPGIRALLEVAGRNTARVVAADFGFAVGPRLNAAGRLDDMSLGIECLLSETAEAAAHCAAQLDALNRERREIEADMKTTALEHVQAMQFDTQPPHGFCLYDAAWHQGVVGILASRIKEQFHRPVIAFADAGDGQLKGSARSIPGLHIRDTLDAIASRNPGLLQKFGGHAMAAGLSLQARDLPRFREAFLGELQQRIDAEQLTGVLESDGELKADDLCLELSELLRFAGPWGQGFPEPLFEGLFSVVSQRVVGERHLKLALRPRGQQRVLDAIAFGQAGEYGLQDGQLVRVAYRLDSNDYRGVLSLQLLVEMIDTETG